MNNPTNILDDLIFRYPILDECRQDIKNAYESIKKCYSNGGKVLICGNGGSAADSDHIVGELMKGFLKKRKLSDDMKKALIEKDPTIGSLLADKLQGALPAIALTTQSAISTAFSNDVDPDLVFAQQVLGYSNTEDILIGLSTSGNSKNVVYAAYLANILGMATIGLTGQSGGRMADICNITIKVPKTSTPEIQELHLPVYHCLCAMIEEHFFA